MRLILASKSPARLETLRRAGMSPEVIVSDIDESNVTAPKPADLALKLADRKAASVLAAVEITGPTILFACDSVLEIDGKVYGKPGSTEAAIARWYGMRGRQGTLHTGHVVALRDVGRRAISRRIASTLVQFADLTDAEIAAYAATGEPERVAGAFTIDGYGGAFITSIVGDPHNVVGISLPLVRQMLLDMGVAWHSLWTLPRYNAVPS